MPYATSIHNELPRLPLPPPFGASIVDRSHRYIRLAVEYPGAALPFWVSGALGTIAAFGAILEAASVNPTAPSNASTWLILSLSGAAATSFLLAWRLHKCAILLDLFDDRIVLRNRKFFGDEVLAETRTTKVLQVVIEEIRVNRPTPFPTWRGYAAYVRIEDYLFFLGCMSEVKGLNKHIATLLENVKHQVSTRPTVLEASSSG